MLIWFSWARMWPVNTPPNAAQFIRLASSHQLTIASWVSRVHSSVLLTSPIRLGDLLHPGSFLSALSQETAKQLRCPIDGLRLTCQWEQPPPGVALYIKVEGYGFTANVTCERGFRLLLQGALFDGGALHALHPDSALLSLMPVCHMAYVDDRKIISPPESIVGLPLYMTTSRRVFVCELPVPCASGTINTWILSSSAVFIQD